MSGRCTATADTHCCVFDNEPCQFLRIGDPPPGSPQAWCGLHDQWGHLWDNPWWVAAPVGRYFAAQWPGERYDCGDWPNRIPRLMEAGVGLCCWAGER